MKATFIIAAATVVAGVGCGSSGSTGSSEITVDQAKAQALQVVPGTVLETAPIDSAEEHRWVVSVELAVGSKVDVEIDRATGVVQELTADTGPFDYTLPPTQPGFLVYADAKGKALEQKPGALEKWEERFVDEQWEFYVRDADTKLWEIKLVAETGALVSVIPKDKAD